jgi:trehalose 6-phosphate synthase/phosphatase
VKRILYNHPEAEFVFCAGDDKVSCSLLSGPAGVTDVLS